MILLRRICVFAVLTLFLCVAQKQGLYASGPGTSGSPFLKLGIGARPVAMGEAYLGLSDDSNAMLWNPAGLAQLKYAEASVMHLQWIADITYEYVGYAMPFKGQGIGLGLSWLNVPSFDSTGGNGEPEGSAGDYSALLTYALPVTKQLLVGATARTFLSNLADQNSFGGTLDVGLMFKPMGKTLTFALVSQNLGLQSSFESESDPLPMNIRLGSALRLYDANDRNWLNMVLDINKSVDNRFKYHLGAEYWMFDRIALRGGYKFSEGGSDFELTGSDLADFTAGAGFRLGAAQLDYAFVPFGELGATHRVSASWKFGYIPTKIEAEDVLQATPKFSSLGAGQGVGVAFNTSVPTHMKDAGIKEWHIDIKDKDGTIVKTLSGDGAMPKNLAWDGRNSAGELVNRDQPFTYAFRILDRSGKSVKTEGFIAQEIKPKSMMSSKPKFDTRNGGFLFKPRNDISVGVKEWTLRLRSTDGTILKTLTGRGAIPKTLQANFEMKDLDESDGVDLIGGKKIRQIKYELEFKDLGGKTKVVSDEVRFATKVAKAGESSYTLPLPPAQFRVNKGREILVAAIPNLTASGIGGAKPLPFVMPVPTSKTINEWRFEVVSPQGQVVRHYKGKSAPPDNIFWDGKDDDGNLVPNASKSRFSFWVVDTTGKKHTSRSAKEVSSPFTMQSIQGKISKISGLWFRFLDTDVQEAILGTLRQVARLIKQNQDVKVTIQGHSWDEGGSDEMLRLSQERADAVLRYLIEEEGISPKNVSAIGYGDAMPIKRGEGEEVANQNRRVEVIIISK